MSIVTLQFGQCGNQLGNTLYSTIAEDVNEKDETKSSYNSLSIAKWFQINKYDKWEPRSILVDTEDKVIDNAKSQFKFKNVIAKSYGGSANNWAYGYTKTGPLLAREVLNTVRCEVEKCDYLSSFLNLFSSSGGTGSGVGGCVIELLRDEYPTKHIANAVILPYRKGEIVTQSYNSLLTLSHLYSVADSTILFENERLHYICKYTMDIENISYSNINMIIAQQLASVYQPVGNIDSISLLNSLTSHPLYRYLLIKNEPHIYRENLKFEGSRQWKNLITALSKQTRYDFLNEKQYKLNKKTLSNALVVRGLDNVADTDVKLLKQSNVYVPWLKESNSFNLYYQKNSFLNFDKFLTLITNNNSVCIPLNFILEDAWNLFTHAAYLHHYKNHGVDEEFFLNSFQSLENTLEYYKTL